ncbi:hypothetical protein MMC20_000176 [Loxospora ochrophaea]|nr:hypothetical protein [Loxospora ochrophaea]
MAGIPRFAQAGGKGKTKLGATRPFSFSAKGHSGHGAKGMGKGKGGMKRHRKVLKDNVHGITKGDIRRLARRGGVKRISAAIYDDVRSAMVTRLQGVGLVEAPSRWQWLF